MACAVYLDRSESSVCSVKVEVIFDLSDCKIQESDKMMDRDELK